jgi:glycerol-1-phosphate dehydrogenase [NAD(P)+]
MTVFDLINHDINCICGKTHRCDIEHLAIGEGVLDGLPDMLAEKKHVLLIADRNTAPLCADRVMHLLGEKTESFCLFVEDSLLVPDETAIAEVEKYLTAQTDFILGIGSGVINDICKYVSFYHNLTCGIIATAPSMDGFASSGAAMIIGGMKITYTTHAPSLILGDVDILRKAPMDMIRSGYADIIGKYSSLCDWKLSEFVNGEYLCPFVYNIVKESTDEVRGLSKALLARESAAIAKLMEILVLIGVTLTLISTTRPGSGSEHHLSHYFEITGLIEAKPYFLHGTDVGYSTVVTAALREQILDLDVPQFHKISKEQRERAYRVIYRDFWQDVKKIQDEAGRYDRDMTPFYASHWEEIRAILRLCPPLEEIRAMLIEIEFDMDAFVQMYGEDKIRRGIWFGKDLKDRYSVLWLYGDLFLNEEEAEKIQ